MISFKTRVNRMWYGMNRRSVNGVGCRQGQEHYIEKGIELRISKEQWVVFCEKNKAIIQELEESGETPSVDRINPEEHYELNNLRIISKMENSRGGGDTSLKKFGKPVQKTDETGSVLKTYPSRYSVVKDGFKPALVWQSIKNKVRHGGFYWRWA